MKNVIVLHETGANSHFRALESLISTKYGYSVKYREFSILRFFVKSILNRDFDLFRKQITNFFTLTKLLFSKNDVIIIGIAPYDWRLIFLNAFLKKHHVFYFTSWPYWDKSFYPKKVFLVKSFVLAKWKNFLEKDVKSIFCVTQTSTNSIRKNYHLEVPMSTVYHSHNIIRRGRPLETSNRKINCLYLGRLIEEKGINEIIEVIIQLPEDEFDFTFAGKGPLKAKILALAKNKKNIFFYDFIKDSEQLSLVYESSDVLLLPSKKTSNWEELFGMVIIEAMAHGLIPITTNHVGPREIIDDKVNGFLINENSIVSNLSQILLHLKEKESLVDMKTAAMYRSMFFRSENIMQKWDFLLKQYLVKRW